MGSFKKLWALILALTICLSMGIPAMAAETGTKTYTAEFDLDALIAKYGEPDRRARATDNSFYRNQLTGIPAALYDGLLNYFNGDPGTNKATFNGPSGLDTNNGDAVTAITAVIADNPQSTYWVSKNGMHGVYTNNQNTEVIFVFLVSDTYKGVAISGDTPPGVFNLIHNGASDIKTKAEATATQIVQSVSGTSLMDKLNTFNNEIRSRAKYDASGDADAIRDWIYVLGTDPNNKVSAVCEAYAKSFKILCDKAGIDCKIVTGVIGTNEAHMWNYVKPDGSDKYYLVDVTNNGNGTLGLLMIGTNNADYSYVNYRPDANAPALSTTDYDPNTPPTTTYTVTIAQQDNVTVTTDPAMLTGLAANTNVTITVTPADGYENPQLYVDNSLVTLTANKYTFNVGTRNHTIRASATKPNTYRVTVQAGEGVDVAVDKSTDLKLNDLVTVTVTAKPGYESPVGLLDGVAKDLTDGKFTFNVTKNHTVSGKAIKETFVESVAVAPTAMTIGWSQDPASITGVEDLTATVTEKTDKTFTGPVTWTSSDSGIVAVSQNAAYDPTSKTATATVAPTGYNGTVTITATAETKTARCTITVTGGKDKPVVNPDPPVEPSVPSKPSTPNYPNYSPSNDSDSKKGRDVSDWVSPSEKSGGKKTSSAYKPVNETNVVNQTTIAVTAAIKAGNKTGTVTVRNALSISYNALKSMQAAAVKAGGTSAVLQADSMKGNAVESRIYIDASKIPANMKGDMKLRVYTSNPSVKDHFTKYYKNKCVVVRLEHEGSFGMEIEVATKVDLSGMSTKDLVFYAYDSVKNSFERIVAPKHFIDEAGYLHFVTSVGGNIIVSDGPLAK